MKKLLGILVALGAITSGVTSTVSCEENGVKDHNTNNQTDDNTNTNDDTNNNTNNDTNDDIDNNKGSDSVKNEDEKDIDEVYHDRLGNISVATKDGNMSYKTTFAIVSEQSGVYSDIQDKMYKVIEKATSQNQSVVKTTFTLEGELSDAAISSYDILNLSVLDQWQNKTASIDKFTGFKIEADIGETGTLDYKVEWKFKFVNNPSKKYIGNLMPDISSENGDEGYKTSAVKVNAKSSNTINDVKNAINKTMEDKFSSDQYSIVWFKSDLLADKKVTEDESDKIVKQKGMLSAELVLNDKCSYVGIVSIDISI